MNVIPKNAPQVIQPPQAQASARDRAIAKLMNQPAQQQETPVANPTQVSPEELSAIKAPESTETSQNDSSESKSPKAPESEAKKPETKEDPLSTQYALLARKEKALRAKVQQQDAATKAREDALKAREDALKAKEAEYQSNYIPKSRFKADPLAVLTEEGVSYDEITKAILNPQAQQDPRVMLEIEKLKAEVKQAKDTQENAQKAYEEQQAKAYTQAVNQIRNDVKQLVQSDAAFETIKETDSVNDVVDLIEKTYHKDGILLSVEDAAKEVEEYLVEEALKLAKLSKIQSRLQPKAAAPTQQEPKPATQQQPQMKTLTNSVNAAKKLSSRERAIAAFKGELK